MPPSSFPDLSLQQHLPDISLRHLPDLSDASFEIPVFSNVGDQLLADDSNGFLGPDEDFLSTPVVPRKAHDMLHLSDLTPKLEFRVPVSAPDEPSHSHGTSTAPPSSRDNDNPLQIKGPVGVSSQTEERHNELSDNSKPASGVREQARNHGRFETAREDKRPIAGKARRVNTKRPLGSRAMPTPKTVQQQHVTAISTTVASQNVLPVYPQNDTNDTRGAEPVDASLGDASMTSNLGGAAERLMLYGQSLLGSGTNAVGLSAALATNRGSTRGPSPTPRDDPLTLSQLSPSKVQARPVSPMRTSSKRSASPLASLDASETRKKGKTTNAVPRPTKVTAAPKSRLRKNRKPTVSRAKIEEDKENVLSSASWKKDGGVLEIQTHDKTGVNAGSEGQKQKPADHTSKAGRMPCFDRPNVTLPLAKPTKPIEFQFKSELRIEARKVHHEERSTSSLKRSESHHPIPDFKALHAAQEAELAARREHIAPVIPPPMELSTSIRAKEREKFEEARRARELEIERQMEERKRQKELEEEKEIRELRKRAVPKANEVPDWYADAPKKKGSRVKS